MSISVKSFLRFAESKSRDERYNYLVHETCASAQYHNSVGAEYSVVVVRGDYADQDTETKRIEWLALNACPGNRDVSASFGHLADFIRAHM